MKANVRFWNHVNKIPDGCWEWTASCHKNGYGSFYYNKHKVKAHRYSYETVIGVIPTGFELDHLCRNRKCVNPGHLEIVTRSENVRRGLFPQIGRKFQESKTHCPHGHPYDDKNTYIRKDRKGRDCMVCRRLVHERWLNRVKS